MNVEQRVREALERAGSDHPVDVTSLFHETRERLDVRAVPTRRRTWPLVLGAAAATVVGALVVVPALDGGGEDRVTSDPEGVADTFTCPVQRTTAFASSDDDSFLPELSRTLRPQGEAANAPRWEVERTDDGALLRLGNEDGSLASVTTFVGEDAFERVEVEKCTNQAPASGGQAELVTPGLPLGPGDFTADDFAPGAVKIVDRLTYDTRGLATRHMVWAEPCGRRLCVIAGRTPQGFTRSVVDGDSLVPHDRSTQLADPDNVVGQDLGYRLVLLYDHQDAVTALSWDDREGTISWIEPVEGGGWEGRLFAFIAPADDLAVVTVHPRDGQARNYLPGELAD
jgi:hypothetical protein